MGTAFCGAYDKPNPLAADSPTATPAPSRPADQRPAWVDLPDEALLDVRMCELGLTIEGSWLEERLAELHRELDARGLTFRPHYWLSAEWFSPDGVPGVAIPFYLAHPRLMRLERAQMLEVEGGTPEWCLKILRHEAGHAFDNAYELRRRRRRRAAVRLAVARRIRSSTCRGRTPRASCCTSTAGTRKAIRMKTLRKRSPCG